MRKFFRVTAAVTMLIICAGCWDRVESRDLALLNSIIYDITEDNQYTVFAEIRNPVAQGVESGGGNQSPSITVSGKGESFSEALRSVADYLEKSVFGGHNKARFMSERMARKGVNTLFDYTLRDFIADEKNFMIVVKGDKPELIYKCKLGLSDMLGEHIESLQKNQIMLYSKSVFVNALEFAQALHSDGKQPVAGLVEVMPSDEKASPVLGEQDIEQNLKLVYKGLAAFKEDKLVGFFDEIEARAYNFITDNVEKAFISVEEEDFHVSAAVIESKSKIKATPKGESFGFEVEIDASLEVTQATGKYNIMELTLKGFFEKKYNEKIKRQLEAAIEKSQKKFESDIFGFGGFAHIQHPKEWKNIKKKWPQLYPEAEIKVKVKTNVKYTGEVEESIEIGSVKLK